MIKVIRTIRPIAIAVSILFIILSNFSDNREALISVTIYIAIMSVGLGIDELIISQIAAREQIADIVLRTITIEEQTK